MSSLNRVTLIGHLGHDPSIKQPANGQSVCNFSLATNETFTDKNTGNKTDKTTWHNIVIWGKIGEACHAHLKKGSLCYVEGKIQNRSYEGKDGGTKYVTEIIAYQCMFLGENSHPAKTPNALTKTPPIENNAAYGGTNFNQNVKEPDYDAMDIPF